MINKAILVGNVGSDPEVRHFENGGMVANFSLATTERYKNKQGEQVENTEWHRIAVFGKLAEVAEKYVKKGAQLYIQGKIKTRSWENKEGVKQYTTEIVLQGFEDTFKLLGKRPEGAQSSAPPTPPQEQQTIAPVHDDLPF